MKGVEGDGAYYFDTITAIKQRPTILRKSHPRVSATIKFITIERRSDSTPLAISFDRRIHGSDIHRNR